MSPSSADPPIYKSHPLYRFRRHIIISCLAAIVLLIAATISSSSELAVVYFMAIVLVMLSGLIALIDLWLWTLGKDEKEDMRRERERRRANCRVSSGPVNNESNATPSGSGMPATIAGDTNAGLVLVSDEDDGDDDKPKWPRKGIMILDFLIIGPLVFVVFCAMLNSSNRNYYGYYDYSQMYLCYATVPISYAVVLHARCWWRALKARQREGWLRELALSVDGVAVVYDVENDVGGLPIAHRHRSDGVAVQRDSSGARGSCTPDVFQDNGRLVAAVKAKLQTLNPEVVKALKSKRLLPVVSSAGERQPLLSNNACSGTHVRPMDENIGRSADQPISSCPINQQSCGPRCLRGPKHPAGKEDKSGNDPVTERDADLIIMDLPDPSLTPDWTATTSDVSSTADLNEIHESQDNLHKYESLCEVDGGGPDTPNGSRSAVSSSERDQNCFIGQDIVIDGEEIMVVRKAKKGKTSSHKGKGRGGEAE